MASMHMQVRRAALLVRSDPFADLIPAASTIHYVDGNQHHRHLDEHAHHGGERRAGLETEQGNGGGHGQLEEIASADQRRRPGYAMWRAHRAVEQVGQTGIEEHLDQDGHRQQRDDQRLGDDLFTLKAEQQDQRGEQRGQ